MTCTDVDPETLKICKERIPTADCILVQPEETRIPCESNSVGLLLCIEVPPVMNSQWFLDEAFRVLQTNGILVGVFLNLLSLRGLWAHTKARLGHSYDYYKLVYPRWRKELQKEGFRVVYEEGYCWFGFRRDSNSDLVPFVTQVEKCLGLQRIIALSPWVVFIARKVMISKNEEGKETATNQDLLHSNTAGGCEIKPGGLLV